MLALDGGGIRCLLTLGILERIETLVLDARGDKLCEYFDYIAGTSTGAIIAASLARGMTAAEIIDLYKTIAPQIFERTRLIDRVKNFYAADPLKAELQKVFGSETNLEPHNLKCLLLIVTKNVATNSPWAVSSNPEAKFNDVSRKHCNLKIPLWQLLRASTAAPLFFPPEIWRFDPDNPSRAFVFSDGGDTPYNNPAFLLYRMATEPAYRLNWKSGEDNLLLVSVGAGAVGPTNASSTEVMRQGQLIYRFQVDQDINCRTIGRCTHGGLLDREILDLVPREVVESWKIEEQLAAEEIPLSTDLGRRFLYARYNVNLSRPGLDLLNFNSIDPIIIQQTDALENFESLLEIGRAAGRRVQSKHFGSFI
jgi:predicted acylesterase/phospholipase RssA